MHYYEVAPNRISRSDSESFTYSSETPLNIGQIVLIQVGTKAVVGVILSTAKKPTYPTKPIQTILEATLPIPLLQTAGWMAQHYQTHLATVLQTILPRGIQKNRRARTTPLVTPIRDRIHFLLNPHQSNAIAEINA